MKEQKEQMAESGKTTERTEVRHDTRDVLEAFRSYVVRFGGSLRSAHRAMAEDYRDGKTIGGVDWRVVWAERDDLRRLPVPEHAPRDMPLPAGWSRANLTRRYLLGREEVTGNR